MFWRSNEISFIVPRDMLVHEQQRVLQTDFPNNRAITQSLI